MKWQLIDGTTGLQMPIIKGLDQGTDKWLAYRQSRIMATDIGIISGSNDFTLPIELWEQKLGLREPVKVNDAMRRGHELEPEARKLACSEIGFEFLPCVYESDAHIWGAASLDGFYECYEEDCAGNKGRYSKVLEIKCPKEKTHIASFEDIIPAYYIDQMQWQMLITESSKCYYFSYRPEYKAKPFHIIEVFPDHEKQEILLQKGHDFYLNMCTMQPPKTWVFSPK